jgi:NAD+ synthase
MDLCLFGKNNGVPVEEIAAAAGLTIEQVNRVFHDIDQKRKTTHYLHLAPELADNVPEISNRNPHPNPSADPADGSETGHAFYG